MQLALLAGDGDLPLRLCAEHPCVIVDLVNRDISAFPVGSIVLKASVGEIGKILGFLKDHQVKQVVLAGGLKRPSFSEMQLDWTGLLWAKRLGKALVQGDDHLLKGIIRLLEAEGFNVIAPHELLETLLTPKGPLTLLRPTQQQQQDIETGIALLERLSPFDVGQAVVIQQGLVLGIEAIEGTEALLDRCKALQRKGNKGVLVKMAKMGQTTDIDLPTIGLRTLDQVKEAGLAGIALSAGTSQIIDKTTVMHTAKAYGLFIVGI